MKFVTKITAMEKKAIYERTIAELEKRVLSQIISLGMDPDIFDEDTFEPETDPTSGDLVRGQEMLRKDLDSLALAKSKLTDL